MGSLRVLLAMAVVFAHAEPIEGFSFGDGRMAVQIFYMISGFYMAMVWSEKYSKGLKPIQTFYTSRALRIYPIYFVVLFGTLFIGFISNSANPAFHFIEASKDLGWAISAWVYLTQFSLMGMETPLFFDFGLHRYMVLSVAWTLGLELTFYLLVPFLMSQRRIAVVVFITSIGARIISYYCVLGNSDSYEALWSYRFFPFEVSLFLAGTFSYWLYLRVSVEMRAFITRPWMTLLVMSTVLILLFCFRFVHSAFQETAYWIYYTVAFFGLIVLFIQTEFSKLDGSIGEFSYPIYISHLPVLWLMAKLGLPQIYFIMLVIFAVSIGLCWLQRRIDNYRHRLIKQNSIQSKVC